MPNWIIDGMIHWIRSLMRITHEIDQKMNEWTNEWIQWWIRIAPRTIRSTDECESKLTKISDTGNWTPNYWMRTNRFDCQTMSDCLRSEYK
jgi:hypothetical protein